MAFDGVYYTGYPPCTIMPRYGVAYCPNHWDNGETYTKYSVLSINGEWWYITGTIGVINRNQVGSDGVSTLRLNNSLSAAVASDHYYVRANDHVYYLKADNTIDVYKTYTKYKHQWDDTNLLK